MERINQQQQATKHPIPVISEAPRRTPSDTDRGDDQANDWLSPAMAIWIQDEDEAPRTGRQDRAQAKSAR